MIDWKIVFPDRKLRFSPQFMTMGLSMLADGHALTKVTTYI
jgi:hypothetical protein